MPSPMQPIERVRAPSILDHGLHLRWSLPLLVLLALLPAIAHGLGEDFYIGVASRVLIFALAATSLNLILGFGGMVSFGHAAFVGIGAYTVGILMQSGIASAWVAWPAAFVLGGVFAFAPNWVWGWTCRAIRSSISSCWCFLCWRSWPYSAC